MRWSMWYLFFWVWPIWFNGRVSSSTHFLKDVMVSCFVTIIVSSFSFYFFFTENRSRRWNSGEMPLTGLLCLLSYTALNYLPSDNATYSGFGPTAQIINGENAPTDQSDIVISSVEFSLPRWPWLVSSWPNKQAKTQPAAFLTGLWMRVTYRKQKWFKDYISPTAAS